MAEEEKEGALKRYVAKVQEHREFESRVKKLRETAPGPWQCQAALR